MNCQTQIYEQKHASIHQIDPALLRQGRLLKVKGEIFTLIKTATVRISPSLALEIRCSST